MRMRTAVVVGLVCFLVVAGYFAIGGPSEPRLRLVFSLDFDRAVREGRIEADADRELLAANTIRIVRERLDRYAPDDAGMRVLSDSKFEITLPEDYREDLETIQRVITSPGELKFRMEVLPEEAYGRWRMDGRTSPRLEQQSTFPWKGSATEFHAFKEEEVRRFVEARDTETAYAPSRLGEYLVVPKRNAEATDVHDFAVLEVPRDASHRFGGRILENAVAAKDPNTGKPVVLYDVKTEYQGAFAEWTGQNVGLPLAIVLNGVYRSAPVINSKLTDSVQITLGAGSWRELEREAEELTTVLQTGSLLVRPTLESVE